MRGFKKCNKIHNLFHRGHITVYICKVVRGFVVSRSRVHTVLPQSPFLSGSDNWVTSQIIVSDCFVFMFSYFNLVVGVSIKYPGFRVSGSPCLAAKSLVIPIKSINNYFRYFNQRHPEHNIATSVIQIICKMIINTLFVQSGDDYAVQIPSDMMHYHIFPIRAHSVISIANV